VYMQTDELKFYLVSRGYTDYETLVQRVESILMESKKS
jgi:putative protein-disulfide isomerase